MMKLQMIIVANLLLAFFSVGAEAAHILRLRFEDASGKPIPDVVVYVQSIITPPAFPAGTHKSVIRSDAEGRAELVNGCSTSGSCCMLNRVSYSIEKFGYLFSTSGGDVPCGPGQLDNSLTVIGTGMELPRLSAVSAASYLPVAANKMIISCFGQNLTFITESAGLPLKENLSARSLTIKDTGQQEKPALMLYASPEQINAVLPDGMMDGPATVVLKDEFGNVISFGFTHIRKYAPGIFTANSDGKGLPIGVLVRTRNDRSQSIEPIGEFDVVEGKFKPVPLDFGPEGEVVVLCLFGTGWRSGAPEEFSVKIAGVDCPIEYAGPQPTLEGLDQLNVRLPRALIGRGDASVEIRVAGAAANLVSIKIN